VSYVLNYTENLIGPDCFERPAVLVNGQFPGPLIRATEGDILEITFWNHMFTDSLSVHLHGITQHRTPFYDGIAQVTQYAIAPDDSFTIYVQTQIGDAGSYFYHAHVGLITGDGPIIIDGVNERSAAALGYDDERIVFLQDWWHVTPNTQIVGLLSTTADNFQWIGNPASILTNGRTYSTSQCSLNSTGGYRYPPSYSAINVEKDKVYRFRFYASTMFTYLSCTIQNHTMVMLEVDGHYVNRVIVDHVEFMPGQRYSVLVYTNQSVNDYWLNCEQRWRGPPRPLNGQSVIRYNNPTTPIPTTPIITPLPNETFKWGDGWLSANTTLEKTPPTDDDVAGTIILNTYQWLENNKIRWAVNNVSFLFPSGVPYLVRAYLDPDHPFDDLPEKSKPIHLEYNTAYDIVIQSLSSAVNGMCEVHPWHLHGHAFWDMGGGPGRYDPSDNIRNTTTTPILRDTIITYPHTGAGILNQPSLPPLTPCGWKRIRFVTQNPGVWLMHCHIPAHMVMGMQTMFEYGLDSLPPLPNDFPLLTTAEALSVCDSSAASVVGGVWIYMMIVIHVCFSCALSMM